MVVMIIIGVLLMLSVPQYTKTVDRSHLQDAINQLTALHAANMIYRAQTGGFLIAGSALNLSQINTGLSINIIANGMTYSYTGTATTFSATAVRGQYTLTLTEVPVLYDTNPTCTASGGGDACPPP